MKKNFKLVAILILLSPILMGKGAGIERDTFYYVSGKVISQSGAPVAGLTIRMEFSDSDSLPNFFLRSSFINRTDKEGNFNIGDSFYYYNEYRAMRLRIRDTVLIDTIRVDSAKHFEIAGEPSGCNTTKSPTIEVYTFPDQTITIP
jgi:hypothetical protein